MQIKMKREKIWRIRTLTQIFDAQTRAKKTSAHLVCASKKGASFGLDFFETEGFPMNSNCGKCAILTNNTRNVDTKES